MCVMEQAKKRVPKDAGSAIIRVKLNVIVATELEKTTLNVLIAVGMARGVVGATDSELAQHSMVAATAMAVDVNAVIPQVKSPTLRWRRTNVRVVVDLAGYKILVVTNVGSATAVGRRNVHVATEQESNVVISAMGKERFLALFARKEIVWQTNFANG